MKRILALLLFFPTAALADDLAAHRALYNFSLASARPDAGLSGVSGQMYYEIEDACDAYAIEHRFRTVYRYAEERPVTDTSSYAAYESKDGREFSFNSSSEENGQQVGQLRGRATRAAQGETTAVYSRPQGVKHQLPQGYLLSSAHTQEMIRRAKMLDKGVGERFFSAVLFDGTDESGPVEIGVFIGPRVRPEELAKITGKIDRTLLPPEAWHIRMALFPLADSESDPAYEMSAILHANGVVSDALVDYKDFVVHQRLAALEKIAPKKCP